MAQQNKKADYVPCIFMLSTSLEKNVKISFRVHQLFFRIGFLGPSICSSL